MAKIKVPVGTSYNSAYNTPVNQQKEYAMSWVEWAAKNRTPVNIPFSSGTASGSSVYLVPDGYDLFITSWNLSGYTGGVAGSFSVSVNALISLNQILFTFALPANANNTFSNKELIKVNSGSNLVIIHANLTLSGGFIKGFLEPRQTP